MQLLLVPCNTEYGAAVVDKELYYLFINHSCGELFSDVLDGYYFNNLLPQSDD